MDIKAELTFQFDSADPALLRDIMRKHGDSDSMFFGRNVDGEDVTISIAHDSIALVTMQENGWVRKNYFNADGYPDGETFEGKWK